MKPLALALPILFLAACSEPAKPVAKKEPPKPELVGAQKAFFQNYSAARRWSQDLWGYQVLSVDNPALPAKDGKYAAWRVQFVSPDRRAQRSYIFSAIDAEGLSKGITQGHEESWSGPTGQNSQWPIQALKVDSDAAFRKAMDQPRAKEYSKKNPTMPVTVHIEKIKRFGNPVYRVIWGASAATSSFSIYVDASTGDFLEIAR